MQMWGLQQSGRLYGLCLDYMACVLNPKYEISQIIPVSKDVVRVSYRSVNDYVKENDTSNIVVSLYTTSIARLKLLSYLQLIERTPGTTILYVDTDSVSQKTFIHC